MIWGYVGQLEKLDLHEVTLRGEEHGALRNVFRDDKDPTPAGTWTEKLVAAFPQEEGNALVVKQIITHD